MLIAVLVCFFSICILLELITGYHSIKNLSQQKMLDKRNLPSVSIVLSALNEEENIEAALLSLLKIDYPNLEIIVINDRSDDRTPVILNELKNKHPELKVFHLTSLPENWFGKNHALYYGSQHATGEWLLFTDADVHMKPDTLSKAVSYVLENNVHHLTIQEHHLRPTFWLKVLLLGNYLLSSMALKPWRVRYHWSNKSIGNGAFNLVKKSTYQACGTHQAIALECLDDLKLGAIIKENGYQQDIVNARDLVQREWYADMPDMIQGLEKNTYSWFNYRLSPLIVGMLAVSLYFYLPIINLFTTTGNIQSLNAIIVIASLLTSMEVCRRFRLSIWYAFLYPAAVALHLFSIINSACSVYKNNGVVWRGTWYPLNQLRNGK